MKIGHRNHPTWWAFVLHRISGVVLALFLPVHFQVLALALDGEVVLDNALKWSDQQLVKVFEAGLIFLLAAHLTGGIRLLALEFLPWRNWQKTLVAASGGLSLAAGLLFLVNAF
jgi:fumarate reductase subunit D